MRSRIYPESKPRIKRDSVMSFGLCILLIKKVEIRIESMKDKR